MNDKEVRFVASELGVEPHHVRQMEGRLASKDEAFDPLSDDDDDFASPSRYLEDHESNPADIVEFQRKVTGEQQQLQNAFKILDERAQEIIRRRWLTDQKSTLHELADEFGISAERIRQLEQNAIKKLRSNIVPW